MNTSRKKYRRSLQVSGIIRLVLLGAISAGVAGGFVVVKNRQHGLANSKVGMESEIVQLHKKLETVEIRIAGMIDRKVLEERIGKDMAGRGLVDIESTETVRAGGQPDEQYASYRATREAADNF